jgi:hypothetical protein
MKERASIMWRRSRPAVSARLSAEIEQALVRVDAARQRLDQVICAEPSLLVRRQAHADLRAAHLEADVLLREATRAAKGHSHQEWSRWRHRLSRLDAARQRHLFQEADDLGVLKIGSVRAIDAGMSGPAIGEFQHGECSADDKSVTYGVDLEAVLLGLDRTGVTTPPRLHRPADVVELSRPSDADATRPGTEVA